MTQLSTDTLAYTQIIAKVKKFIDDYSNLKNVSPNDYEKAYQKLLFDIHRNIGGSTFDISVLNQGDVPSSELFNNFIAGLTSDLNIVTNQFDSLAANYVNTFNLFANQIEAEKSAISRVRSKINVLEMYSKSSSVNIFYFGDSFNDLSFTQPSKITPGYIPDVSDGYASLAKTASQKWRSKIRVINESYAKTGDVFANTYKDQSLLNEVSFADPSNGLRGNNFTFENDGINNKFLYEKDSPLLRSNESNMIDDSAATYFEYEAISILALNDPQLKMQRPTYEFEYIDGKQYVNWASFDKNKPLKLTVELTSASKSGETINTISVLPFFGYDIQGQNANIKNIQITSIKLFDEASNKTHQLINSGPVTIASDISGKNISNYKNFFHNKGVFVFDEKKVNKVYITFEQKEFRETLIKHAYWTPYEVGSSQKWNNQNRFNPSALTSSSTLNFSWDKNVLVPNIANPTEIKSSASDIRQISFSQNETKTGQLKHQLKITSGTESFYWYKRDVDLSLDLFCSKDKASFFPSKNDLEQMTQRMISNLPPVACVLIDPSINILNQINNLKISMTTISNSSNVATITTLKNHNLINGDKVYIRDRWGEGVDVLGVFEVVGIDAPNQFRIKTSSTATLPLVNVEKNYGICIKVIDIPSSKNLFVESGSEQILKSTKVFLNLKRNFEYLKADRASIGVRDISLGQEVYSNNAEIISKPFFLNGQLELLSLEVSEYIPQSDSGSATISYYVSVNGGNSWIAISPIDRGFNGIPEILAFNQNLSDNLTIPQIAYYNQPEVPASINSVIFRAIIKKSKSINSTPILYWYKFGARLA